MSNQDMVTPENVQPSSAPTEAEIAVWNRLSAEEKTERWQQALVDGMNSPETSYTIEQIKAEVDQEFVTANQ